MTEVPWIFAVPTGANKVTVYWDPVPGATGYRVRWGTVSGSYPGASEVLSGLARQYTVSGLVSEQEYYFVVEAEWNGVWGPPLEEDSAVPHVGAIPWDTQDTNFILSSVRSVIGYIPSGELSVLGPDGLYYEEDELGNPLPPTAAPGVYRLLISQIDYGGGVVVPRTSTNESLTLQGEDQTGPYRRVRTNQDGFIGGHGWFYLPPLLHPRTGAPLARINDTFNVGGQPTEDTPCVYFGIRGANWDVEGGLMLHHPNRGQVGYYRWQPYLVSLFGKGKRQTWPVAGDNLREYISIDLR